MKAIFRIPLLAALLLLLICNSILVLPFIKLDTGIHTIVSNLARVGNIFIVVTVVVTTITMWFEASRSLTSKMVWSLILVFVPIIGLLTFYVFSNRYNHEALEYEKVKELQVEQAFHPLFKKRIDPKLLPYVKTVSKSEVFPVYPGAKNVDMYSGASYFENLIHDIEDAQNYIFMQTFIFKNDVIGNTIADLLIKKANEGVEVKIIIDDEGVRMHDRHGYEEIFSKIEQAGIKVVHYNKVEFIFFNPLLNHRNHRKINLIDGKVAYFGGMNIGDEYQNTNQDLLNRGILWRDLAVRLSGHSYNGMLISFIEDWAKETGEILDFNRYAYVDQTPDDNGSDYFITDGPHNNISPIYDVIEDMFKKAKKEIVIATPYLAIDPDLLRVIYKAANRWVKIKLILPGKHEGKAIPYKCLLSYIPGLLAHNIEVYMIKDTFIHSKYILVDEEVSFISSVNMDNRSFFLHFECGLISTSEELIKKHKEVIVSDLEDCELITKEKFKEENKILSRVTQWITRLFWPVL